MKKPSLAVQEQVALEPKSQLRSTGSSPSTACTGPTLLSRRRKISYIPGEKLRTEPPADRRMFVRGLGGSIELGLSGVGVRFSEAAFAHLVSDNSLCSFHICQGDIALIEPVVKRLRDKNLLLLEIDGLQVLRRIRKVKRLWMLESCAGSLQDVIPLIDQGIQGVVIGFVRVLKELKPVTHQRIDPYFGTNPEISCSKGAKSPCRRTWKQLSKTPGLPPSLSQIRKFLAANRNAKTKLWLSEIDKAIRYQA